MYELLILEYGPLMYEKQQKIVNFISFLIEAHRKETETGISSFYNKNIACMYLFKKHSLYT
jgi:hypothetical protein